jgi:hypothetical protein
MVIPEVTTVRQDTSRIGRRRVSSAARGSDSTDQPAADRSRSTSHIDDLAALRRRDHELS